MQTTREARGGRGVDVRTPEMLGTLATHAPRIEEFQFVKFRVEGEVAHLRLDRPDQNLLNERMLMEIAAGINSVSEKRQVKLVLLDSAGKTFSGGIELGEYTQRRVFQLLDAFHSAFAAMMDTSKPVIVVVNGPAYGGGAGRPGDRDAQRAFCAAGNQVGSFSPIGRRRAALHSGPEDGDGAGTDRRGDVRGARARSGAGEFSGAGRQTSGQGERDYWTRDGAVWSGVDHGEESDSGQPGIAAARGRAQFHESFSERAGRPGRFAGRSARAGGKARTEVEEPVELGKSRRPR